MRISDWSSDVCSSDLVIGVVNVIFTLVAITQSDKFGRKPLLVVGLIGMVISLVTVGVCFYTGYTDGVLVLGMLVLFIACFALSVGPVTWILINEIFPDDLRVAAVSICTFARSEEHTSELQSLMRISSAVFCL